MHELSALEPGRADGVLDLYASHAPMPLADMYRHYLSDWEEEVRMDADLLADGHRAAALAALDDDDLETLAAMGFEVPSFFYTVIDTYRLASDAHPAKGGGFSCWR